MKRSCDFCHRRKLKCNGKQPCEVCEKRTDVSCSYERQTVKPGPKTTGKAGKIRGAVSELHGQQIENDGKLDFNQDHQENGLVDEYFAVFHPLVPIFPRQWLLENFDDAPNSFRSIIQAVTFAYNGGLKEAQTFADQALFELDQETPPCESRALSVYSIFFHLVLSHIFQMIGHYDVSRIHLGQCVILSISIKLENLHQEPFVSLAPSASFQDRMYQDLGRNFQLGLLLCLYIRDWENSALVGLPPQYPKEILLSNYPPFIDSNIGQHAVPSWNVLQLVHSFIPLITRGRRMLSQRASFTKSDLASFIKELNIWYQNTPKPSVNDCLYILFYSQYHLIRIMACKGFLIEILLANNASSKSSMNVVAESGQILDYIKFSINELVSIRSTLFLFVPSLSNGWCCSISSRAHVVGSMLGLLLGISSKSDLMELAALITPAKERLFIKSALDFSFSVNLVSLLM